MKETRTMDRKNATRGLHFLAVGGIIALIAMAGTALIVIGPDKVNASEIAVEPTQ